MYTKKDKDPLYFEAHTAITFALNKVLGQSYKTDEKIEKLTDEYWKLSREFDGAMKNLAERREKELK